MEKNYLIRKRETLEDLIEKQNILDIKSIYHKKDLYKTTPTQ